MKGQFNTQYDVSAPDYPINAVKVDQTGNIWVDLIGKPWARYYFSDECSLLNGPFLTKEEALAQELHYVKYVLG